MVLVATGVDEVKELLEPTPGLWAVCVDEEPVAEFEPAPVALIVVIVANVFP